jgi:hypothetical protein
MGWLLSKNSLELASLVTCWIHNNATGKLGPRAIIAMMPMKSPCSCLAINSFMLDASHCNGLKERSTYKICAELPDITLQYHMKEHNHFFDFMMLHELLTTACQEITCILWNLRVHYHVQNSPPHDSVLCHINPV